MEYRVESIGNNVDIYIIKDLLLRELYFSKHYIYNVYNYINYTITTNGYIVNKPKFNLYSANITDIAQDVLKTLEDIIKNKGSEYAI